jgi:hypothetical protein
MASGRVAGFSPGTVKVLSGVQICAEELAAKKSMIAAVKNMFFIIA